MFKFVVWYCTRVVFHDNLNAFFNFLGKNTMHSYIQPICVLPASHIYTRRALLASLISALCHHATVAAEEISLPDIIISAPAPLTSATSLSSDTLYSLRPATSDSARLLHNIPGVNLQGAGGVSSLPVIHGLADDRLRIKVDGMDLISACGNHMNPPLSYIDPAHVSHLEVFAGISPVSAGGDSLGSAILVESAPLKFAFTAGEWIHEGEIGTFYRSNNNARGANLSATLANDRLSMRYQGASVRADNYRAGGDFKPAGAAAAGRRWLDADEVGSSMYESHNHALNLGLRHQQHTLELKLGIQDIPYQGWPNQRMDMTANDSTQVNIRYLGDYDWGSLEARTYSEQTRHAMQFFDDKLYWYGPNATAPHTDGIPGTISGGMNGYAAGMPMDTKGDNRGALINAEHDLSERDLLKVGAEAQRYRLDDWWQPAGKGMWPNTFWNIRNGERDRLAVFSEWEARWNTHWMTQLGLRYEHVTMDAGDVQGYNTTSAEYAPESAAFNAADRARTDHNFDMTALVRFTPDTMRSIDVGYARKTRSPNLYERYTWSSGGMAMRMINMSGDGNGYVGNLALEPEVAHTVSTALSWKDGDAWSLKATPYYTRIHHYIDARRCVSANSNCDAANQTRTDGFVYLQFVNESAHLFGLDLSGEMRIAEKSAYGDFSVNAMLSYVRGENRNSGDNLYNIMPLNAKIGLNHRLGAWNNVFEAEWVDAKTNISQVRNELTTEAYHLFHLRSSYQWKQVRLDFGVENLWDKFYSQPLGGAYSGQGKTMSGTDVPWGVAVPGMGRSFYAGLNISFK
jgi:iron complex outermembrane recepter protein